MSSKEKIYFLVMYGKDKRITSAIFSICKIRVFVKSSENLEFFVKMYQVCCRVVNPDPHCFRKPDPGSPLKLKFRSFRGSKWSRGRSQMGARLKKEPWWVCRPVFADSHHFDEQDPQPCYFVGNCIIHSNRGLPSTISIHYCNITLKERIT